MLFRQAIPMQIESSTASCAMVDGETKPTATKLYRTTDRMATTADALSQAGHQSTRAIECRYSCAVAGMNGHRQGESDSTVINCQQCFCGVNLDMSGDIITVMTIKC